MKNLFAPLCALLSGAAFYFSLQLGSTWPIAWVAPIPILWFAYGNARSGMVLLSTWAAYSIGSCNFLPVYFGQLPTPILAISILLPGLLFGGVTLVSRFVAQHLNPLAGAAAMAAFWTGIDYVLSFGPNGTAISWAYSQVGAPLLIQGASLFGLWFVTFLLVFVASGIAIAFARRDPLPAIAALVLFTVNAGFGYVRIAKVQPSETVRIGLASDDRHPFPDASRATAFEVLNSYASEARVLGQNGARIIVFPEKVAVLSPELSDKAIAMLGETARKTNATIVIGLDDHATNIHRNDALIFAPGGTLAGTYNKRHMVPGLEDQFTKGSSGFMLSDHTGVAICKDMDFQATLRADAVLFHPTLLLVPAWDFRGDGWWHARLAIMRSVEQGFSLARASKEGLLTLSDAYGRIVVERATTDGMTSLVGVLPRGPGATIYQNIGDVFAWGAIVLAAVLFDVALVRKRARNLPAIP